MASVRKIAYQELRPHMLQFASILLLRMGSIGLDAFAPWPFKLLIDNVLGNIPLNPVSFFGRLFFFAQTRTLLGYVVVALFFLSNVLLECINYIYSIFLRRFVQKIIFQFSRSAFLNVTCFDLAFFRTQEIGDYIYRLSYDVAALGSLIEDSLIPLFSSSIYLAITTVVMMLIDLKLTIISLIAFPFLAAGLYIFNERIVRVTKQSEHLNSGLFSFIQGALTQLRTIQAFSQEKRESSRFNEKLYHSLNVELRLDSLNFGLTLLIGLIITCSYSIIIIIGFHDVLNGILSTGLLIVFIFYLDNLTAPLLSIIYALSDSKESAVRINRVEDFFRAESQTTDSGVLDTLKATDDHHTIRFEKVTLLGNENVKILDSVSCTMKQGEISVVVGISGSGKSSLISLIPRLLGSPSEGQIYLGENTLGQYSLETLRSQIAFVPQEAELFNDTIYNTICYGKPTATMDEVYEAARLADAHEFITELPHGYNTHVGESGHFLSGGQRQRLMIARALIRDSSILVMDEPLAYLDIRTRQRVWQNIKKFAGKKTIIVVSNVISIISEADHVIVLNKGKVMNEGKHHNLLKENNVYKLIVREN